MMKGEGVTAVCEGYDHEFTYTYKGGGRRRLRCPEHARVEKLEQTRTSREADAERNPRDTVWIISPKRHVNPTPEKWQSLAGGEGYTFRAAARAAAKFLTQWAAAIEERVQKWIEGLPVEPIELDFDPNDHTDPRNPFAGDWVLDKEVTEAEGITVTTTRYGKWHEWAAGMFGYKFSNAGWALGRGDKQETAASGGRTDPTGSGNDASALREEYNRPLFSNETTHDPANSQRDEAYLVVKEQVTLDKDGNDRGTSNMATRSSKGAPDEGIEPETVTLAERERPGNQTLLGLFIHEVRVRLALTMPHDQTLTAVRRARKLDPELAAIYEVEAMKAVEAMERDVLSRYRG